MKRFIAAAALFLMSLSFGGKMSAGDFGLIGGANFCSANIAGVNAESMTQWHAGLAYKFNLPLGFHIQPALLYNVKGSDFNLPDTDFSVGYLELMASVQWGIDLILFRPFLDLSPYVGYAVNKAGSLNSIWKEWGNPLGYGVGVGGGLDIWRFQLVARYNWDLDQVFKSDQSISPLADARFRGLTLSLAYFF
jgi:hypothetical protein